MDGDSLTIDQVAEALGVTTAYIESRIATGDLQTDDAHCVPADAFEAFRAVFLREIAASLADDF